ncbi:hypothetical protein ACOSP7_015680 [Xanthoceras sorbifolium]|uniref:FLZ-type domain-containing protein n=1 Tax=Xanthoceras sorbifolium TaxID=99658 RepID=A0ABQ8I7C3_9ROSI|nr:hypothetical protein JRO89_XS04G0266500 [Xanthoceras sorbifolium]
MDNLYGKRKPAINLSLFTNLGDSFSFSSNPNKSPRNFHDGVVGLGIVAAMNDLGSTHVPIFSAKSPRTRPISIVSSAKPVVKHGVLNMEIENNEVDELSESYTCVISHFGDNLVKKRVYFDDDKLENYSVLFAASSPMDIGGEFWSGDFLSSCFLCKKQLHGLDIFMYRGEKAFCSAECRDKQIRSDDHKDKCGSEARKPLDYSISPCSGTQVIFAGVAVA